MHTDTIHKHTAAHVPYIHTHTLALNANTLTLMSTAKSFDNIVLEFHKDTLSFQLDYFALAYKRTIHNIAFYAPANWSLPVFA